MAHTSIKKLGGGLTNMPSGKEYAAHNRYAVDDSNTPMPPQAMLPPLHYGPPQYGPPPETFLQQGFRNFGGQMQGAMSQMAGLNMANQAASQNNRAMWVQNQRDKMGAQAAMAAAYAPVMAEQVRASALGKALGLGSGGGGMPKVGRPRYSSNIGQGIEFYPGTGGGRPVSQAMARQNAKYDKYNAINSKQRGW